MRSNLRPTSIASAIALCLAAGSAAAQSGEFTFVTGEVAVVKANGQRTTPGRGTAVEPGDRISTGVNGMAQLTMVDQARLSLRPNTTFTIEAYPQRRDGAENAVLSLARGTLRTFTGLLAGNNRDKFVMKTRVATVGIRGSGNILYACEGKECDESVAGPGGAEGAIAVNHTIEGSHSVTNQSDLPGGTPPQQGGAATLITGPGQTVMVRGVEPPRYIPTPSFIADVATNMTNAKAGAAQGEASAAGPTRNFAPSDTPVLPAQQQNPAPLVGNNGLGFPTIDASGNLSADPIALRDIIISLGSPFAGQAVGAEVQFTGSEFRGYRAYIGATADSALGQGTIFPYISGGSLRESGSVAVGGGSINYGRYEGASLGFSGPGTGTPIPGSIHFIHGPSGYPVYLSDVLTGTATYTLAGATSPTNQANTTGALSAATINVNFSDRTLDLSMNVSLPGAGSNAGGSWNVSADNVAIALNGFSGSTNDRMVITNGTGADSRTSDRLSGGFQGSFVGSGNSGIVLGYGINDRTSNNTANHNQVTGVAAFTGPAQDSSAPYREGRVSDPAGTLADFVTTYATTNRPAEVTSDASGRVTAFTAPFAGVGARAAYAVGSAQVLQQGADPETGLVWGRWSGGTAQVGGQALDLNGRSLHYIFAGTQSGPVALPLTGAAIYDVIGSTSPTDNAGHVGTLNNAALSANFTARTVDVSVNLTKNGQTWTGSASGVPIYRDQYFSAYTGNPIPGGTNPAPLNLGCTPNCGGGATGSFDGFFTGRNGSRAGLMYNLGGNQGAVAFGRRGG
jgi:hypothetical protein